MKHLARKLIRSDDNSHTLFIPELNEHYHSKKGALRESKHIFIEAGLNYTEKECVSVLEIGFGTGLNAYLSLIEALEKNRQIFYTAVEKYPLEPEEWRNLNYPELTDEKYRPWFNLLHETQWNRVVELNKYFTLQKLHRDLKDIRYAQSFDLVYFDAFAPDIQPELWSEKIFKEIFSSLKSGGILVTYSVKGSVRRTLEKCGFSTCRLPGPPGKRQMLRAIK